MGANPIHLYNKTHQPHPTTPHINPIWLPRLPVKARRSISARTRPSRTSPPAASPRAPSPRSPPPSHPTSVSTARTSPLETLPLLSAPPATPPSATPVRRRHTSLLSTPQRAALTARTSPRASMMLAPDQVRCSEPRDFFVSDGVGTNPWYDWS